MEESAVAREIERLHRFFEDWFRGEPRDLADFTDSLSETFYLVSPHGYRLSRSEIIESVESAYGRRDVSIEVRAPALESILGGVVVATYEEHHADGSGSTSRLSTAVLSLRDTAPGGFIWEAVHETWMPGPGDE